MSSIVKKYFLFICCLLVVLDSACTIDQYDKIRSTLVSNSEPESEQYEDHDDLENDDSSWTNKHSVLTAAGIIVLAGIGIYFQSKQSGKQSDDSDKEKSTQGPDDDDLYLKSFLKSAEGSGDELKSGEKPLLVTSPNSKILLSKSNLDDSGEGLGEAKSPISNALVDKQPEVKKNVTLDKPGVGSAAPVHLAAGLQGGDIQDKKNDGPDLTLTASMCHASSEDRMLMPRTNKESKPLPTRVLNIIIDHEKEGGPTEYSACESLISASHPVLLSKQLVDKIFFQNKINPKELRESLLKAVNEKNYQSCLRFLIPYCQALFDEKNWEIYQPNNSNFVLFIPHSYNKNIAATEVFPSELDMTHGLRLSTMQKHATLLSLQKTLKQNSLKENSFLRIFIENKEYEKNEGKIEKPQWVFFMEGHGMYAKRILGMNIVEFKTQVIPFFAQSITTKLLAYSSCYANGINACIIYNDGMAQEKPQQLPFPIVLAGMPDFATTHGLQGVITLNEQKNPIIQCTQNSKKFFHMAMHDGPVELVDLLSSVYISLGFRHFTSSNATFIRYPKQQKFVPLLRSLIIGPEDSKRTEPIDFKKALEENKTEDPHYVFLTTPNIEAPLIINTDKFAMGSMLPGPATHVFSYIEATISLKILSKNFWSNNEHEPIAKNFFIKKLKLGKDNFFDVQMNRYGILFGKQDAEVDKIIDLHTNNQVNDPTLFTQYKQIAEQVKDRSKA